MLNIHPLEVNPLSENCYMLSDETGECAIIDCGALYSEERTAVSRYLEENRLRLVQLWNTHLHFDHVWGNGYLYEQYQIKTAAHLRDQYLYADVPGQIRQIVGMEWKEPFYAPFGQALAEGDEVKFGSHIFRVIETPGHTPGGICFYCEEEQVLFSGDSLFYCGIGRTDFPGGDGNALVASLKDKILTLPPETKVYTGHGPATTIETERKYNPYLR